MSRSNEPSRRRFLKQTAAAALGGISLPQWVPGNVLASPDRPGANDRIGVGYIGCGRRANQIMGLPKEGVIVAGADVNLPRAEAVAKRATYKSYKAYQDYRQLLDNKDIDAVIVAAPDHWRAIQCIHVCQAGKDVFVEKPFSLTIKEGRAMVEAVRKYKRVLQTGSQQRSMEPNRIACELIRNGRLGKIHTIIGCNYPSPWLMNLPGQPAPDGLDWDAWCGQAPLAPFHKELYVSRGKPGWLSVWPYSGGEMTGWGAHGFDQIQWALDADESGPLEVWSTDGPYRPKTYTAPVGRKEGEAVFKDKYKVTFRYPNGVIVKLDDGSPAGGVFIGEKGKIDIRRNRFFCNPPDLAKEPLPDDAVRLDVSPGHMQNWFDCMKSRKDPICHAEIGHRSSTVCHLGNIARWVGRKLRWDPVREIFPDDEEANQYLDIVRRKPYELPNPI